MSHQERTGKRALTYSAWHRTDSIKRFMNNNVRKAMRLTMIDIDGAFVEAKHPYDRKPAALTEVAEISIPILPDSSYYKNAAILTELGKAANVPVYVVLYRPGAKLNPADTRWPDIEEFYVKECFPIASQEWHVMQPSEYADFLIYIRYEHKRIKRAGYQATLDFMASLPRLNDLDLERYYKFAS